jgi:hypothetical protein
MANDTPGHPRVIAICDKVQRANGEAGSTAYGQNLYG